MLFFVDNKALVIAPAYPRFFSPSIILILIFFANSLTIFEVCDTNDTLILGMTTIFAGLLGASMAEKTKL